MERVDEVLAEIARRIETAPCPHDYNELSPQSAYHEAIRVVSSSIADVLAGRPAPIEPSPHRSVSP